MSNSQEHSEAELDQLAADLARDAQNTYEQKREEQQEFLDTVAEEEGAEILETQCNLIGDYTVPLRAKLNGELMDHMGAVDARLERLENEDARAYELSEVADETSQILADAISESEWHKEKFYEVYEAEGLEPLGAMLERVFESLEAERERQAGVAQGFQSKPDGS